MQPSSGTASLPWRAHFCGLLLWLFTASNGWSTAGDPAFSVSVEAGPFDRRETTVVVTLPPEAKSGRALRRGRELIPLQVGKDGRAMFRLEELKKGTTAVYELVTDQTKEGQAAITGDTGRVQAQRDGTKLRFTFASESAANRPAPVALLDYQMEEELPRPDIRPVLKRGGYLHPVRTLNGLLVTDDYPPNHLHHHGVWGAWTKTQFQGREPDFWNMGEGKGRVEFVRLDSSWEGQLHAGFHSTHRFVDLTTGQPVTALDERWKVTVFRPARSYWMFDLESVQTCATPQPLGLPEYHYGGLGVRGHRAWDGKTRTYFLTSEGESNREKAHATRARWCDMGGEVEGKRVGLAILGHPDNFRAPQPMRVHPTEPFFCFAPQQAGEMSLAPGQVYRSLYRFIVHDGPPAPAELDRLWNDFASPPAARVVPVKLPAE